MLLSITYIFLRNRNKEACHILEKDVSLLGEGVTKLDKNEKDSFVESVFVEK